MGRRSALARNQHWLLLDLASLTREESATEVHLRNLGRGGVWDAFLLNGNGIALATSFVQPRFRDASTIHVLSWGCFVDSNRRTVLVCSFGRNAHRRRWLDLTGLTSTVGRLPSSLCHGSSNEVNSDHPLLGWTTP